MSTLGAHEVLLRPVYRGRRSDELDVHTSEAIRRPRREIILNRLAPNVTNVPFREAYHAVYTSDEDSSELGVSPSGFSHPTDTIVATFAVRGCRKVVLDDEAGLPHTVGRTPEVAHSLVLLGAAVRAHVHAGRPVSLLSGSSCCTSVSTQIVVGDQT